MSAELAPVVPDEKPDGERFTCEVPTTCQPPSAYSKDPWPAVIRDITNTGLSLTLNRRFERGSGLAIELPTEDGTMATVLAKVVHVRSYPEGGWVLGCDFISELSDEEVQLVLNLDPVSHAEITGCGPPASLFDIAPASVSGVLFQAKVRKGEILRWYVKRLDLAGGWPLARGRIVSLRVGGLPPGTPPLEIKVRDCRLFGSYWIVDGRLSTEPPDDVLHLLLTAPTLGQS
jgi:hypothetical protein